MRQMPTEARNFRDVDKEWKVIMLATQKDPMVLPATGMETCNLRLVVLRHPWRNWKDVMRFIKYLNLNCY